MRFYPTRQSRLRSSDPACHCRKIFSTSSFKMSNVGKNWLWRRKRLVNFQTLSIGFSSGQYGGRYSKTNLSDASFLQIECNFAWWYLALSVIIATLRPEWHAALRSCFKNFQQDIALNDSFSAANINFPSRNLTAPKYPTLLRPGCCRTNGDFSSGGNHIRHRVPCCWKSTSSIAHIS